MDSIDSTRLNSRLLATTTCMRPPALYWWTDTDHQQGYHIAEVRASRVLLVRRKITRGSPLLASMRSVAAYPVRKSRRNPIRLRVVVGSKKTYESQAACLRAVGAGLPQWAVSRECTKGGGIINTHLVMFEEESDAIEHCNLRKVLEAYESGSELEDFTVASANASDTDTEGWPSGCPIEIEAENEYTYVRPKKCPCGCEMYIVEDDGVLDLRTLAQIGGDRMMLHPAMYPNAEIPEGYDETMKIMNEGNWAKLEKHYNEVPRWIEWQKGIESMPGAGAPGSTAGGGGNGPPSFSSYLSDEPEVAAVAAGILGFEVVSSNRRRSRRGTGAGATPLSFDGDLSWHHDCPPSMPVGNRPEPFGGGNYEPMPFEPRDQVPVVREENYDTLRTSSNGLASHDRHCGTYDVVDSTAKAIMAHDAYADDVYIEEVAVWDVLKEFKIPGDFVSRFGRKKFHTFILHVGDVRSGGHYQSVTAIQDGSSFVWVMIDTLVGTEARNGLVQERMDSAAATLKECGLMQEGDQLKYQFVAMQWQSECASSVSYATCVLYDGIRQGWTSTKVENYSETVVRAWSHKIWRDGDFIPVEMNMAALVSMRDGVYAGADEAYRATVNGADGNDDGGASSCHGGGGLSITDGSGSVGEESHLASIAHILGQNPMLNKRIKDLSKELSGILSKEDIQDDRPPRRRRTSMKKADGEEVVADLLVAGAADLLSNISLGETGAVREAAITIRKLTCPAHVPMLYLLRTPRFHRAVKLFVDHAHERLDFAPYEDFLAQFDAIMDSVENDIDRCSLSGNFDMSEEEWDDPSSLPHTRRRAVGKLLYGLIVRWSRSPAFGNSGVSFADYSLTQMGAVANLDHMTNRPGEAKSGIAVSTAASSGTYPGVIDEAVQTEAVLAQDNATGKYAIATHQLLREASPYEKKKEDEKKEEDEDEQHFFTGDEGESSDDEGDDEGGEEAGDGDSESSSDGDGDSSPDDADDEDSDDDDEDADDEDSDDDDEDVDDIGKQLFKQLVSSARARSTRPRRSTPVHTAHANDDESSSEEDVARIVPSRITIKKSRLQNRISSTPGRSKRKKR